MSQAPPGQFEIRGHSRVERPASLFLLFLAGLFDSILGFLLLECVYWLFHLDPLVDWKLAIGLAATILIPWAIARRVMRASLGEKIWRTREGKTGIREASDNVRASILTLSVFAAACGVFHTQIGTHPYWTVGREIRFTAALPPNEWRVLSFYYTMAPWPVAMEGKPVFYSIPYEMAPPKRFIGHIESEWIRSSVRVVFEGPKTPTEFQSRVRNRAAIHDCILSSPWRAPRCAEVRKLTLDRHLEELRASGYTQLNVDWFSSENPAIPEDQRAQGVRLRAQAGDKFQDRYILITPQGLHQTIAISYLDNVEGHDAERDFEIALGALRISEDLSQGRAWTDNILQSTHLTDLPPATDDDYLQSLSQIQSLLVSKLSVDPGLFDPYYHLAGSHMLLLKYCVKHPDPGLKSLAQAMVERMDRFAHDVAPRHPDVSELDRLFQDAKQF